jgi:hypothetical protein
MGARLRSWWQQVKQHRVTILVGAIILVVAIALISIGYRFDWTGFNGNNKSGKTLWDWLQLLIIPAVLTLGAIWYTARQNHDLHITLDNQRETVLQTYFDNMSELLLHENLRISKRRKLDAISLEGAYLQGANLSGTVLWEAILKEANLAGADLTGANLKGVTGIAVEELKKQAKSLKGTTMPDGSLHP